MKVEDGEEITKGTATTAVRRSAHFFSALQASDGHWPAENAGPLFFLPPLVSLVLINTLLATLMKIMYIYIYIYIFQTVIFLNGIIFMENAGILSIYYKASRHSIT